MDYTHPCDLTSSTEIFIRELIFLIVLFLDDFLPDFTYLLLFFLASSCLASDQFLKLFKKLPVKDWYFS